MSPVVMCRFTDQLSLLAMGERFWIIGRTVLNEWYDLSQTAPDNIVSAVCLDEGIVHLATEHGAVYEIRFDPQMVFVVAKMRNA